MDRSDLQQLSREQLIELVLRLQRPDKSSRTSSKPPSTDKKEKGEHARPGGAKLGHEPHNRRLADDPDAFRDHAPTACEHYGGAVSADEPRDLIGEYDEIEIPPVKPYIVLHRRYACRCSRCGSQVKAPAPAVATTTLGLSGALLRAVARHVPRCVRLARPCEEKVRVGKAARSPAGRRDWVRSRPRVASQDRARPRSVAHILRLSWRGGRHQQRLGAKAATLRDPTKGHQRLSRHVGPPRPKRTCAPPSTPRGSPAEIPSTSSSPPWPKSRSSRQPRRSPRRRWVITPRSSVSGTPIPAEPPVSRKGANRVMNHKGRNPDIGQSA